MAFTLAIFFAILAAATASVLPGQPLLHAAPVAPVAIATPVTKTIVAEPYDPNPQYSYGYDVQDPLTGDSHGQVESRSGDVVRGSYSLLDADGTKRVIDYTADSINGFNAVVSKQPVARVAVAPAPVVAAPVAVRTVAPAPVVTRVAAPIPVAPQPVALAAAPVLSAPLLRSAAPVLSGLSAAPWAGSPVLRTAPVLSAGPWATPALRAAPWATPSGTAIVRSAPLW